VLGSRLDGILKVPWISVLFLGGAAGVGSAQVSLTGGETSLTWTKACGVNETFQNNTGLVIAGVWLAVDPVGYVSPEIRTMNALGPGAVWVVDDNEDRDLLDANEGDDIDGTPLVGTNGWHRVQAAVNGDRVAVGASFTLNVCSELGTNLTGTVRVIPIASEPGQPGGQFGRRITPPVSLKKTAPTASVSIDPTNAPSFSNEFSIAVKNTGTTTGLKSVQINPTGVGVSAVTASGGGVYYPEVRTVIWPTPIPIGGSEQVNVTLTGLVSILTTVISFTATFSNNFGLPVPALPGWSVVLLAGAALCGLYWVLQRRA
jgi:hypothetical protein